MSLKKQIENRAHWYPVCMDSDECDNWESSDKVILLDDVLCLLDGVAQQIHEKALEIDKPSNDYAETCKQNRQYRTLVKEVLALLVGEGRHKKMNESLSVEQLKREIESWKQSFSNIPEGDVKAWKETVLEILDCYGKIVGALEMEFQVEIKALHELLDSHLKDFEHKEKPMRTEDLEEEARFILHQLL